MSDIVGNDRKDVPNLQCYYNSRHYFMDRRDGRTNISITIQINLESSTVFCCLFLTGKYVHKLFDIFSMFYNARRL